MKLMRYGRQGAGEARPASMPQGHVRDLSGVLPDITPAHAGAGRPGASCAASIRTRCRWCRTPAASRVPWSGMGKFICIGLNYADHAAESGQPVPEGADRVHEGDQRADRLQRCRSCCRRARSRATGRSSSAS